MQSRRETWCWWGWTICRKETGQQVALENHLQGSLHWMHLAWIWHLWECGAGVLCAAAGNVVMTVKGQQVQVNRDSHLLEREIRQVSLSLRRLKCGFSTWASLGPVLLWLLGSRASLRVIPAWKWARLTRWCMCQRGQFAKRAPRVGEKNNSYKLSGTQQTQMPGWSVGSSPTMLVGVCAEKEWLCKPHLMTERRKACSAADEGAGEISGGKGRVKLAVQLCWRNLKAWGCVGWHRAHGLPSGHLRWYKKQGIFSK